MKIKVNAVYTVEDAKVIMERIANTTNGAPRYRATVVVKNGAWENAYTFNVIGYNGEAEEAKEAYRRYVEYKGV